MSSFADDLRAVIAKKAEQLHVEEFFLRRKRGRAAAARRDRGRRRRAARDVFRPLVEEFYNVSEAAGVLCGGSVEECSVFSVQCSASGEQRGSGCRLAPPAPRRRARTTKSASRAPSSRRAAWKRRWSAKSKKGRKGEREKGRKTRSKTLRGPRSSMRLPFSLLPRPACGVPRPSPLLLTPRSPSPLLLAVPSIALPRKTFRTANLDRDAARRWCSDLLKKCAAACMEANRR